MMAVIIALIPATLFGVWQFGWPAFNLVILCVVSAIVFESLCLSIRHQPQGLFLGDGSAALTGLLVAMTLPPWAPWWIALCGSGFAIIVGKHIFGGIGQNIFNPAMLARVALLISFPVEMTRWLNPTPLFSSDAPGFMEGLAITFGYSAQNWDALTGASILDQVKTGLSLGQTVPEIVQNSHSLWNGFAGLSSGSLGETSSILIMLGGLWLIYRSIISWHAPIAMIATVGVMAGLFNLIEPERYIGISEHLFSGGLMLGAFFIITDPVTSPSTIRGELLFGFGCGLITFVIRTWGLFPEGVAFAVLIMNSITPLIDYYVRPRLYGYTRSGKPQNISNK
jgi:electron transport complex protein RnfD